MSSNVNKLAYTENEKVATYYCSDCDYYSIRISDYKKHLLTKSTKKCVNKCKQTSINVIEW